MLSTTATSIKDVSVSPDGQDTTFVLVTKHSGDIAITVPTECLAQLGVPSPVAAAAAVPATPTTFGQHAAGPAPATQKSGADQSGNIAVRMAQKWLIGADKKRSLLIVVLDHQMPDQYAFALSPTTAFEFATALTKQGRAISDGMNELPSSTHGVAP